MTNLETALKPLSVSRETLAKLDAYHTALIKWQKAKNLVAPSTLKEAPIRHFMDSAQLAPLLSAEGIDGPILDIGSGAGFPGLVLSIMGFGPVHLVESNGKKSSFLRTVIRETKAEALVHNDRIEALSPFPIAAVTARACATVVQLLDWSAPFLSKDTKMVLLKGAKWQEELTEAEKTWMMQCKAVPSKTDPTGRILILSELQRR